MCKSYKKHPFDVPFIETNPHQEQHTAMHAV